MAIILVIFLLLGISVDSQKYFFVDQPMSWTDAQQYCREKGTDLATITSLEDINEVPRPSSYTGLAWIGLFDDPVSWHKAMTSDSNSWRWSATEATDPGGYHIWSSDTEPNFKNANQFCVFISNGKYLDYDCTVTYPFACYTDFTGSAEKQFFVIGSSLSWYDARAYCRSNYKDLAMIENEVELNQLVSLITPHGYSRVWIGMYREPWRWSDNTVSAFMNWRVGRPDNSQDTEHCVVEDSAHAWGDVTCALHYPFICQRVKSSVRVKMSFSAGIDLSDPKINKQILQLLREKFHHLGDMNVQWKITPKKK